MKVDIARTVRLHVGKLSGLTVGIMSGTGLFGILFGFVVGILVDEVLRDRVILRLARRYMMDPSVNGLDPHWQRIACLVAISCTIVALRRECRERVHADAIERVTLTAQLNEYIGLQGRAARLVDALVDRFFEDGRTAPGALVRRLADLTEPKNRESTMGFFLRSAAGEEKRITAAQRPVLETISDVLGVEAEIYNRLTVAAAPPDVEAYRILGISPNADAAEVRRVYRLLAAQFHPDSTSELDETQRAQTDEAFLRIKSAYNRVLDDMRARR